MSNIEDMIAKSTCFGVAWDGSVKECKICEVRTRCESKCKMGIGSSEPPKKPESIPFADKAEIVLDPEDLKAEPVEGKKATKPVKEKKVCDITYADDMPDFKPMSVDDLIKLYVERGGDATEFDKYGNPQIKKMRVIMALKKTYIVG